MLAKASGAIACLDLPFHVDDLIDVIIARSARSHPIAGQALYGPNNLVLCPPAPTVQAPSRTARARASVVKIRVEISGE